METSDIQSSSCITLWRQVTPDMLAVAELRQICAMRGSGKKSRAGSLRVKLGSSFDAPSWNYYHTVLIIYSAVLHPFSRGTLLNLQFMGIFEESTSPNATVFPTKWEIIDRMPSLQKALFPGGVALGGTLQFPWWIVTSHGTVSFHILWRKCSILSPI